MTPAIQRLAKWTTTACTALALVGAAHALAESKSITTTNGEKNIVKMHTSHGVITIELFEEEAPITTANFIKYAEDGFFNDTIFHRVIPKFVIQGGGFDENMRQKPTRPPIVNEADNNLKNLRGTLSMARTSDPNSATSQFFINLQDNPSLDAGPGRPGYAVFGKVVAGMDVVDAIAAVKTGSRGMFQDVPARPVIIQKAEPVKASEE